MKSPDELGFAVSYFGDYHGNSKRQYIAVAVKAVAGGGHLLQVLESYSNQVVVNDPPTKRRFISFSRLHQVNVYIGLLRSARPQYSDRGYCVCLRLPGVNLLWRCQSFALILSCVLAGGYLRRGSSTYIHIFLLL